MRRLSISIISLICMFALSGCGGSTDISAPENVANTSTTDNEADNPSADKTTVQETSSDDKENADASGAVVSIEKPDESDSGISDAGNLKLEYSYDGSEFIYNDSVYDVSEISAINYIMDCRECGDWIILDGHVNTQYNEYLFFNTGREEFLNDILGTQLIWQGDDIYSAVSLFDNKICDFSDREIGFVQDGIANEISFSADGKSVIATCYKEDAEDDSTFTVEFRIPENDYKTIYAYEEYVMNPIDSKWKTFRDMLPDDAIGYVMVNPPSNFKNYVEYDEGEEYPDGDTFVFVALVDNTAVGIDGGIEFVLDQGKSMRITDSTSDGVEEHVLDISANDIYAEWRKSDGKNAVTP